MEMPGRKYSNGSGYRYGFNGKEKSDEIEGDGNIYDYGFRIYNPRIGKFLSVDPLTKEYAWYTPYQFAGNKPIKYIDLDGKEESLPYLQDGALECIDDNFANQRYIRGKAGENLASKVYIEHSALYKVLMSFSPFQINEQPKPYVAQALNFANGIGTLLYKAGTSQSVTENSSYVVGDVCVRISSYSEIGEQIFSNLRSMEGLKNLDDNDIRNVMDKNQYIFSEGKDYSILFWHVQKLDQNGNPIISFEDKMQLADPVGTIVMPLPVQGIPIAVSPTSGAGTVNTKNGDLVVSTSAIAQEIANTLAPRLLQMAEKKQLESETELDKAQEQLEGIEHRQETLKQNKAPGQKKQQKINSIKKSIQRVNNALKNIKSLNDVKEE